MTNTVSGGVRALLRLEGLFLLAASVLAYAKFGEGWAIFTMCFWMPDVSLPGYLAGSMVGAAAYNIAHSLVGGHSVVAGGSFPPPALRAQRRPDLDGAHRL